MRALDEVSGPTLTGRGRGGGCRSAIDGVGRQRFAIVGGVLDGWFDAHTKFDALSQAVAQSVDDGFSEMSFDLVLDERTWHGQ